MAKVPTVEETTRAILDQVATYNPRAGEIVPLMGVMLKLDKLGFRHDEVNAAFEDMEAKGLVAFKSSFLMLTDAGFAAM